MNRLDDQSTYSQMRSRLSFLPYFGGKQRFIKNILPLLPKHIRYEGFNMVEVATRLNTDKMALNRRLQRHLTITNYDPRKVLKQGHAGNRGDGRREVIDIHDHIEKEEWKRVCLAHIPQLGLS